MGSLCILRKYRPRSRYIASLALGRGERQIRVSPTARRFPFSRFRGRISGCRAEIGGPTHSGPVNSKVPALAQPAMGSHEETGYARCAPGTAFQCDGIIAVKSWLLFRRLRFMADFLRGRFRGSGGPWRGGLCRLESHFFHNRRHGSTLIVKVIYPIIFGEL